ncbi:hypothetical protein [Actinoplanes sp. NPDC049681]|uniref:hypothetical protein n=1 Tax=Actinoplanes sp. NPDC049681 TaxID=3363905 RepID=UPI00379F40FF
MTGSRIADLCHRVLPAVLVVAGLAVMGTAIVEATIDYGLTFGPADPTDDTGMNGRIRVAGLLVLAAAFWTVLTGRRWWVPATLAAPTMLVTLPSLFEEVPRNGLPILGFVPAAMLVTVGMVGNAMALTR